MKRYFTKTFFVFLVGFLSILCAGYTVLLGAAYLRP